MLRQIEVKIKSTIDVLNLKVSNTKKSCSEMLKSINKCYGKSPILSSKKEDLLRVKSETEAKIKKIEEAKISGKFKPIEDILAEPENDLSGQSKVRISIDGKFLTKDELFKYAGNSFSSSSDKHSPSLGKRLRFKGFVGNNEYDSCIKKIEFDYSSNKPRPSHKSKKNSHSGCMSNKENKLTSNDKLISILNSSCVIINPSNEEMMIYDVDSKKAKTLTKEAGFISVPLNFALSIHKGNIYLSGGDKIEESEQIKNTYLLIINKKYSIIEKSAMCLSKRQHTLVSDDASSKIYCLGGYQNSIHLKECEVYDSMRDKWTEIKSLHYARRGITGIISSGFLFAICGSDENPTNYVERLNISSMDNEWELLKIQLFRKKKRFLVGAANISNNEILLFGGYNNGLMSESFILNAVDFSVNRVNHMSRTDYFFQRTATVVDDSVYILGSIKPYHVHIYSIKDQKWSYSLIMN